MNNALETGNRCCFRPSVYIFTTYGDILAWLIDNRPEQMPSLLNYPAYPNFLPYQFWQNSIFLTSTHLFLSTWFVNVPEGQGDDHKIKDTNHWSKAYLKLFLAAFLAKMLLGSNNSIFPISELSTFDFSSYTLRERPLDKWYKPLRKSVHNFLFVGCF